MKNKILLSIIVVLLPITIFTLRKQVTSDSPVSENVDDKSKNQEIYIDFLINNEKKKFVENKKNNIKYRVISEDSCDKNKVSLSDESKKSVNDDVNNLINIVGDDIIEYM